jgi:tRNA(Ile)-lysidine synthase
MHLFRGCGLTGLAGMDGRTGILLRPLLDVSRAEIDRYVAENKIPFVADESNSDNRYTRNFIRGEVLPRIKEKYPGVEDAVLNLAKEAREAVGLIRENAPVGAVKTANGAVKIPLEAFLEPSRAFYALKECLPDDLTRRLERVHFELIGALAAAENGAGADLPGGCRAVREYDCVTVYKPDTAQAPTNELPFTTGKTDFNGVRFTVGEAACERDDGRVLRFDLTKIPPDAVFRFRRGGDVFKPYGGGGAKKLKEYLIDKKIPVRLRDRLIVIASGNRVLLIGGVEISDEIKITNGDGAICYFKLEAASE